MDIHRADKSLRKLAEELGCNCCVKSAQTGTIYLTVHNPHGNSIKIRIADHADAYGRADYTCDDVEGTLAGARKQLIELRETSWLAVRRLRRIRRNRNRWEQQRRRETWIQGILSQHPELYTRASAEREAEILFPAASKTSWR